MSLVGMFGWASNLVSNNQVIGCEDRFRNDL